VEQPELVDQQQRSSMLAGHHHQWLHRFLPAVLLQGLVERADQH
jgi:hypothetical protein